MTLKFENPAELQEQARRNIKDGEIVLKAAGLGKIDRVQVEIERDGRTEQLPIPDRGDAYDAAFRVYSRHDGTDQRHEAA
jgi:hypothetical protein